MKQSVKTAGARRLPFLLIGGLLAMWLLMNQTLAPGQILLGALLATALAWSSLALRPVKPRVRNLHLVPLLVGLVLVDIVRSNVGVARIVLGLVHGRNVRSGFVEIPLQMRDPHGLAFLAAIVTSTPGTVWVDWSSDTGVLTLHVLDLRDPSVWIDWIKNRYEGLLVRIFE